MRATRGSAASAARRPSTSSADAAIANANSAGFWRGARPDSDTSTMRLTRPIGSLAAARSTIAASSRVNSRSVV